MESKEIIIIEVRCVEFFGDFGTLSYTYDPYWDGPLSHYEGLENTKITRVKLKENEE